MKIVTTLHQASPEIEGIYRAAWTMCSDATRTTLYALGVNYPSDLSVVRYCSRSGSAIFRGHPMEALARDAYLEFLECLVDTIAQLKPREPKRA